MFETIAEESQKQIDSEIGLIRPSGHTLSFGAHSQASGSDVRSSAEFAVALAMTRHDDLAWKALGAVLDHQDINPRSFTYGNFFWHSHWKTAWDPNAVSFIAPCLCYVLRHRGDSMPDALKSGLREGLSLAIEGLNAHRATWEYTNIALLNMASKLLIGDVLDDPRARDLSYWDWEEWRNHSARLGAITEYNSVCYTYVQIHALAMMLTCNSASEQLLREVREAMRHLITAAVFDYHPAIGRITGPQSRAYEGDRRLRGHSAMDWVMHLTASAPEPQRRQPLWLGVPIGPEDVLPEAADLSLTRTTLASTQDFSRTNYLAPDFALGSISRGGVRFGHGVPFFLTYKSASSRCTIPIQTTRPPAGHFSCQRGGTLLTGCTWLIDPNSDHDNLSPAWWKGRFTGLNTGRPHELVRDQQFAPEFVAELGIAEEIRLFDGDGKAISDIDRQNLRGTVILETESVRVGLRFFTTDGSDARLVLSQDADGEMALTARGTREGVEVNPLETALFLGFLLHVSPRTSGVEVATLAQGVSALDISVEQSHRRGWKVSASLDGIDLKVNAPAHTGYFYSAHGAGVTPNQWAVSLEE
ncbi:MAG: hypothetical protein COZ05_00445 [Armatimonadetes bacterium CG_4_10_14_3_um_filter_59_10]|nr:MAG: hypothetical protein COZ05_00445 [Armatimonadetes bacterium CG_4_10_14_3_um_filter_59_10]